MDPKRNCYFPYNNGTQEFMVKKSKNNIYVYILGDLSECSDEYYDNIFDNYDYDEWKNLYTNKVFTIKNYEKVFIPKKDTSYYDFGADEKYYGNSILVKVNDYKYIHICTQITEIKTKEEILKYKSPMGRSYCSWSMALGTKYAYFPPDGTYLPIKYLNKKNPELSASCSDIDKKLIKKMNSKVIYTPYFDKNSREWKYPDSEVYNCK